MQKKTIDKPTITVNSQFLAAALEVGDLLLDQAVTDNRLIYWKAVNRLEKTVTYDHDHLYSGGSGIGLFFLELYKHTGRKKYLQTASRAIRSAAIREKSKSLSSSFLCGRIGIAYALIKLYEVTGTQAHRAQALAMAKSCRSSFSTAHEYLNGNAGIALGLLYIYNICKEPWLLEMADEYVAQLLRGVHHDVTGIYWDGGFFQVRPLCGFSHGVSGIGFVFMELGRCLNNPALYTIAEQAFAYENAHFDNVHKNWPDFRLNMWKPEQITDMEHAYKEGRLEVFSAAGNMAAWCHGAPGIALSRIAAYQLTGSPTYLDDINHALDTTAHTHIHDISLCHGLAGNLEPFIESYLVLGRKSDWKRAHTSGAQLQQRWKQLVQNLKEDAAVGELLDPSLFLGLAGVGYTFLRLHDPRKTSSILAVQLSPLTEIPRSQLPALQIDAKAVHTLLSQDETQDQDVALHTRKLIANYPSRALLYIKQRLARDSAHQLSQLSDEQLAGCTLQLSADCSIYVPAPTSETTDILLFKYTISELEQRTISQFCCVVLDGFKTPRKVQDVIEVISKQYGFTQSDQKSLLGSKVLEQVRQALNARIIEAGEANKK